MTTSQQASLLRQDLIHIVKKMDIAGYILDEISNVLNHLNYYKLLNLHKNIESFKEYLLVLDDQNTKEISLLLKKN